MEINEKKRIMLWTMAIIIFVLYVSMLILSTPILYFYPRAISIDGYNDTAELNIEFDGLSPITKYIQTTNDYRIVVMRNDDILNSIYEISGNDLRKEHFKLKIKVNQYIPNGEYKIEIETKTKNIPILSSKYTIPVYINIPEN